MTAPTLLISKHYRQQNMLLHEQRDDYGASAHRWAVMVARFIKRAGIRSALDYGCGKQTLQPAVSKIEPKPEIEWNAYDPAIPGLDAEPKPADLVVCTDVLEHVEPECLDAVLDDLRRCAVKYIFLVVSTRPAVKWLPDGRNTHLIIEPYTWWLPKIWQRWQLDGFQNNGEEFVVNGQSVTVKADRSSSP